MSIPAERVRPSQAPGRLPPEVEPATPPIERGGALPISRPDRPAAAPRTRRPSRRGTVGFLVLCAVVLGLPALALVTLNALLAESSFHVDDLQQRIGSLSQQNLELTREHASLSAPGRIAAWARRSGMRLPDDIRSLHVSDGSPAAPAGDADPLARQEASLKPILEEGG